MTTKTEPGVALAAMALLCFAPFLWAWWLMLGASALHSVLPAVPAFGYFTALGLFLGMVAVKIGLTRNHSGLVTRDD